MSLELASQLHTATKVVGVGVRSLLFLTLAIPTDPEEANAPLNCGDPVTVKVATGELLLDTLIDNPNIKAAVLVDDRGLILESRGSAKCIRSDEGEKTLVTSKRPMLENVYIVETYNEFLIVVFDERLNFERLKQSIDNTLAQFGLAVDSNAPEGV